MKIDVKKYPYPRRRIIRGILKNLTNLMFLMTSDFKIIGEENFPKEGPLLVAVNHFSFMDPLAVIKSTPWKLDFLGGTKAPNSPASVNWLRHVYGIIPVARGSVSRETFIASESILAQKGVVGIFPEGGSWATVLRPPRPGVAFLAARTGAPILPIGLEGFEDFMPALSRGKRPKVVVRVGKPFGPINMDVRSRDDRKKLDDFGHEIMQKISELIPPEKRGFYSKDPVIREAARGTEIYPWDNMQEV